MLVRVRSKDGNFRFELTETDDASVLATKILETTVDADPKSVQVSSQPRGGETALHTLKGRNLKSLGLKHGDLIFVSYKSRTPDTSGSEPFPAASAPAPAAAGPSAGPAAAAPKRIWDTVKEDPVDDYWRARDGKITRGRDARFCKHTANGMCDYCMPLEPYDQSYHASHSIKHISYHAWIRKLQPQAGTAPPGSAASILPPLTPTSYKVKTPCPSGNHSPWPAGICTACQPSAITLQPQPYRMVDHVEFADHGLIDQFLQAWRGTGAQRFGWLIGHFEPYEEVPMGIKAVVEAIHEPPQDDEPDGLSLHLPWEDDERIRKLASLSSTPLTIVGQIFTDLTPNPDDKTKSLYKRHPQSFYLSGLETIFAAALQLQNPTASKSSSTGQYSSRFVTVVVSGNQAEDVDIMAYQASEQACAMVEADMIEASVEPSQVRVKEEDQSVARYVPDVFYRFKNEYGIDVKSSAKPCFPVEYLIVTLTHGFPKEPSPIFRSVKFPIENRASLQMQTPDKLFSSLREAHAPDVTDSKQGLTPDHRQQRATLARLLSDWHLLAFLDGMGIMGDDIKAVVRAATAQSLEEPTLLDGVLQTDGWRNLMAITAESAPAARSAPSGSAGGFDDDISEDILNQIAQEQTGASAGGSRSRTCPHCTFENTHGGSDCEVCGLPLG
ncbi:polyubiquitin-tagged protein recognition complex, Npl4 component [Exidia glandulosa HHB12029]|uniref:Nuclear protein localization protein 4 n=1 Tax=Exidia glandulosa HHB12029 TaxID=1314781 RepID=A0A165PSX4_EXIGL|nr:polyubiquitin-tagged protein recognition complex, Npl4 component [Exidia glandulosa HHB12029]